MIGKKLYEDKSEEDEIVREKWNVFGRPYTDKEKRLSLSKYIQMGIEAASKNSIYWFVNKT